MMRTYGKLTRGSLGTWSKLTRSSLGTRIRYLLLLLLLLAHSSPAETDKELSWYVIL